MTTQEQIEVMQAYIEGKTIEGRHNTGLNTVWFITNKPNWNWDAYDYRIKPEPTLPKTWKEFCETHPTETSDAFIGINSDITSVASIHHAHRPRSVDQDRNLLPSETLAEAMLALCQLIQLRDCYNEGWKPDWSDYETKFTICNFKNEIADKTSESFARVLSFRTQKLRDEFLNNFRELIEIAKPLI